MLKQYLHLVMLASAIAAPAFSYDKVPSKPAQEPAVVTPCVPGVIYVKFRAGSPYLKKIATTGRQIQSIDRSKLQSTFDRLKMLEVVPFDAHAPKDAITRDLGIDRMYCVYYADLTVNPHSAASLLLATGEVEECSARYQFPLAFTPNDPGVTNQYALNTMKVIQAWDHTIGDTSVVIADVDCAVNIDHEDLKSALKINWGETGVDKNGKDKRTNGIDDDGDGVIDDWSGVDVVGGPTRQGTRFVPDGDPRPDDPTMSHGTETAGCISATGNNGKGIAGVAYGCKLMPIKASDNATNITGGYEGIHWAVTHGARIVNCSWGGPVAVADAAFANTFLQEAMYRNSLIVAAAGNNASSNDLILSYPANGTGVLSVGASDENDASAPFSDFGHAVSVWAPGMSIYTCSYPGNNTYASVDGTSFSSPLTAGVAGLVASIHPEWPPKFIAAQIVTTCDNSINGGADRTNFWGRVNAQLALETTPTTPGLLANTYSINNVMSDSLGLPGQASAIKVTFKNYLGAGVGLTAQSLPMYGGTSDPTLVSLGDIATGGTTSGTFHFTRPAIYSQGVLALRFAVQDNQGYADTLMIPVPLKHTAGFSQDFRSTYGSSIKRVTNADAWAAYGFERTGATVSGYARESGGIWDAPKSFGATSEAVYCVEAIDDMTAWFGTGSTVGSTIVYNTQDAGSSWTPQILTAITPFVNTIHFFDDKNGILIGDPKNLRWGIATTANGGTTWKPLTARVPAANSEASWNNSACWIGPNGWFGTNFSRIWRTTDRGLTWKSSATPNIHSLSVAMDDDTLHGFACFRPAAVAATGSTTPTGKSGLALTANAGVTWSNIKMPDDSMQPGSVRFIPRSHIAIITSDRGTFRTNDFGSSWIPVGVPVAMLSDISDMGVSSQDSTFILTVTSSANGVASYADSYSPIPQKTTGGSSVASNNQPEYPLSIENNPNPFTNGTTIVYSLPSDQRIHISLYDATGREVTTVLEAMERAGNHSIALDGKHLVSGMYYCTMTTSSGMRVTRALSVLR